MSAKDLKLKANGPTEQCVLDYLKDNASAVLIWKINQGDKTIAGALKYAEGKAKKHLVKGSHCVAVDDVTMFGWIIHFFEEDSIKQPKGARTSTVKVPGNVRKQEEPKEESNVLELFSLGAVQ